MLKEERQAYIIHQINLHNKVLSSDLSVQLNVSEDTIRRDLNELAENGQVLKVYGGALSKSFQFPFQDGNVYAKESKKEIARKSISLIQNGMTVLVGGGTTVIELARIIPEDIQCTFFTISPLVALELAEKENIEVISIGGKLSRNTNIVTGAQVINELSEIKVDLCILGTNSLSIDDGITDSDWEVVQIKRAMIKCSHKVAILSIAEKLNSNQKMKVAPLRDVSFLVTDLTPDHPSLKEFAKTIKVI
ncbi:DeoR/GlpR family DNA-binding transcription regulator [Sphingobacterium spiritivorum]|uniref:Transcriptional regulator, DeoR family n=3 Tax=Sphingobacterium spiritivorum TaxID=258 RepID=D7VLI7_SPHSI|nr:DeoR/GlpR family DNA-binding transcription regulator [Sphingobacterium spiritivorum]EEI94201.1 transcriptional regulator, DeoR family [Sphingobacterium spiritivorum ATCC 33300]EFK58460.1 transcriptional regulator, DeoR family [Sphingobacterium spiritivorum ATCC 33861]QQS97977.1 DeoR/GlpR transcriptional regulator [Sphingobacterium spiritivorum]QQT37200.1 DeoR/GlpR transcriptional regulator [Sphingobacterium spiritivorum]WQD33980.1 DeoR/GlpR family DNA-binding transcription regulator [Sphing